MFAFFISSGLFLGWSLGANAASNVFGTAVGSKMLIVHPTGYEINVQRGYLFRLLNAEGSGTYLIGMSEKPLFLILQSSVIPGKFVHDVIGERCVGHSTKGGVKVRCINHELEFASLPGNLVSQPIEEQPIVQLPAKMQLAVPWEARYLKHGEILTWVLFAQGSNMWVLVSNPVMETSETNIEHGPTSFCQSPAQVLGPLESPTPFHK